MNYQDYARIVNAIHESLIEKNREENDIYTGKVCSEILDMIENAMNEEIRKEYSLFASEWIAPEVRYSNSAGGKYIVS